MSETSESPVAKPESPPPADSRHGSEAPIGDVDPSLNQRPLILAAVYNTNRRLLKCVHWLRILLSAIASSSARWELTDDAGRKLVVKLLRASSKTSEGVNARSFTSEV